MAKTALSHLLVATAFLLGGCDFFKEMGEGEESEDTDGADDSDGVPRVSTDGTQTGSDTDTGAIAGCDMEVDDYCASQDMLQTCDGDEPIRYDCGLLCGGNVNLTCLDGGARHDCYCVAPGKAKILSCTELEDCLLRCENPLTGTCADQCYGRTTAVAIRAYGALVHCAATGCEYTCERWPEACAACINEAFAGTAGDCATQRSVCDNDRNDDDYYP